ncbi:MAG: F0F1 ATP synthase subunit B family protein [Desulfobaccales bacterium]
MNLAKRVTGLGVLLIGPVLLLAGAAGASEAAHGGIDPAKVTDLILRTVNFLIFAGILIKLLAKPAKGFFAKRSQDIAQSLEDLEAQKAAAAAALAEAEAKLAQVAAERDKIIQQYISEGEMEKAQIVEKAEMVAARIKEMAAMTISQETKKATQELKQEIADISTKLAEDLLKEKVTYADQLQLVEEYLQKVVEAH